MGHDTLVAQKHYWRVTEDDFTKATGTKGGTKSGTENGTGGTVAAHITAQQPPVRFCDLSQAFAHKPAEEKDLVQIPVKNREDSESLKT